MQKLKKNKKNKKILHNSTEVKSHEYGTKPWDHDTLTKRMSRHIDKEPLSVTGLLS